MAAAAPTPAAALELRVADVSVFRLGQRAQLLDGRASGFVTRLGFSAAGGGAATPRGGGVAFLSPRRRAGVLHLQDVQDNEGRPLTYYPSSNADGYAPGQVYRSAVTGVESRFFAHGHGYYFGHPLNDGWTWNPKQVPLRPAIKQQPDQHHHQHHSQQQQRQHHASPRRQSREGKHRHHQHAGRSRRGGGSREGTFTQRGGGGGGGGGGGEKLWGDIGATHVEEAGDLDVEEDVEQENEFFADAGRPRMTRFASADVIRVFHQHEPANAHVSFGTPPQATDEHLRGIPRLARALSTPSMQKLKKLDKLSDTVQKLKTGFAKVAHEASHKKTRLEDDQTFAKYRATLAKYRGLVGQRLFWNVTELSTSGIRSGRNVAASKREELLREVSALSAAIERTQKDLEATRAAARRKRGARKSMDGFDIASRDVSKYKIGQSVPILVVDGKVTASGVVGKVRRGAPGRTAGTLKVEDLRDGAGRKLICYKSSKTNMQVGDVYKSASNGIVYQLVGRRGDHVLGLPLEHDL